MRLILIRHGEPDYSIDSLTEKGWREAEALSQRIVNNKWNVTDFYTSSYGRAKDTAKPTLEKLHRTAEVLDWAHEFDTRLEDPITHHSHLCWDFIPETWMTEDKNFREQEWVDAFPMNQNPAFKENYEMVCTELDKLLLKYGYKRDGRFYRTIDRPTKNMIRTVGPDGTEDALKLTDEECQPTVVIFCHLGAACIMMSHLLNIPFETLPHGLFLAPSSVTVLTTEERWEDQAMFRAQVIGDYSHLLMAGEPVSSAGAFQKAFQK